MRLTLRRNCAAENIYQCMVLYRWPWSLVEITYKLVTEDNDWTRIIFESYQILMKFLILCFGHLSLCLHQIQLDFQLCCLQRLLVSWICFGIELYKWAVTVRNNSVKLIAVVHLNLLNWHYFSISFKMFKVILHSFLPTKFDSFWFNFFPLQYFLSWY